MAEKMRSQGARLTRGVVAARTALHPISEHIAVEKLELVSPVVMLWTAPATGTQCAGFRL